jgi:hypothetical protein
MIAPMLTNAVVRSMERVPIRTRESNVTRSAWRMEVSCDEGAGAIILIDDAFYRGEGLFLGWPQEELAAAYASVQKHDDEPPFELMQLG